jgi:hypothetical protein
VAQEEDSEKLQSCGLWTQASYINHCCNSTARRAFIGDMMIVRATRDMEAGTEVTFWYHVPGSTAADLQQKLKHWGFVCDCSICADERVASAAVLSKREGLRKQAKHLFESSGKAKTSKMETTLEELEKTYSKAATEVPRMQLWDACLGLAQVYAKMSKPEKCLKWAAKALNSLGFVVAGLDSSPTAFSVAKWGLLVDQIVGAFLVVRDTFIAIGALEKSAQAEGFARLAYKMLVGEDSSFSTTYGR